MAKNPTPPRKKIAPKSPPRWSLFANQTPNRPTSQNVSNSPNALGASSISEATPSHIRYANAHQAYRLNDLPLAKQLLDELIEHDPHFALAYDLRGITHARLKHIPLAIADFKHAISLNPKLASAYSNLANAFIVLNNYVDALPIIQQAIALEPNHYDARYNLAIIQSKLQQTQQAIVTFAQLEKDFPEQFAKQDPTPFMDIKKQICDWQDIKKYENHAKALVIQGKSDVKWALVHINNHAMTGLDQRLAMSLYTQQNFGFIPKKPFIPQPKTAKKIRVAYISADFCDHATTRLMAEVFESHNHSEFEYYAISHSPDDGLHMQQRVIKSFDHFIDINAWSDEKVVDYLRQLQIDIAVDLKGYTGNSRLGIFARRVAPIQISYLGFPATTGAEFLDYIIGDKWVTPLNSQSEFSEKILQLPHCYQPNDRQRYLPPQASQNVYDSEYQTWRNNQRQLEGIDPDALVLCCFNNTYKLHPDVFDIWLTVLQQHPNAIIWLLSDKPATEQNLKNYAQQQGVEANRVLFAPRSEFATYLTRYLLADIFVDTLAYNAHTTGSDALWMGLPIVTCRGNSFASRVGESLLNNANLPQLVTTSLIDYKAKILELCNHPQQLKVYSQHLRDNRFSLPLFNAPQFSHDLETLYKQLV